MAELTRDDVVEAAKQAQSRVDGPLTRRKFIQLTRISEWNINPISNPYAPGAGTQPPELAGRDELRETVRIALKRVRRGLPTKSVLMVGLRGVGKTVLLDRIRSDVENAGIHTMRIETLEGRSLPAMLAPQLRVALLRLSRNNKAKNLAARVLRGLAGFAKAMKAKYQDIEVGLDFDPEPRFGGQWRYRTRLAGAPGG